MEKEMPEEKIEEIKKEQNLVIDEFIIEGVRSVSNKHRKKILRTFNDASKIVGVDRIKKIGNIKLFYIDEAFMKEIGLDINTYALAFTKEMAITGNIGVGLFIRTDLRPNREVIVHEIGHLLGELNEENTEAFASKIYPKSQQAIRVKNREEMRKLLEEYKESLDEIYKKYKEKINNKKD